MITSSELQELDPWRTPDPAKFSDPVWRMHNLYHVKDEHGKVVRFVPNTEQDLVIRAIHEQGIRNILIVKARQLGMSTVIEMLILDMLAWGKGIAAAIVDQTQADATKKLVNKIKLGWDYLPKEFRDSFETPKDSESQLRLKLKGRPETNEVQAGMTARGDTFQILHISEWGVIQALDAARSEEIITGAMPAAKAGIRIIETTWKGGKNGHLWALTKTALETPPEHLTEEDFQFFFFPWWNDAEYETEGDYSQIPEDVNAYFNEIETNKEVHPFKFSNEKRLWYHKKAMPMGLLRFSEFPTITEEAFTGTTEGIIYHEEILTARTEHRILNFKHSDADLVHTFWDLGAPHNTCTWYIQFIGREVHIIDVDFELDLTLTERTSRMLQKNYKFGYHFLPHDSRAQERHGKNFLEEFSRHVPSNTIRVVPRTKDVWAGINHLKELFPRLVFNKGKTEEAIERLDQYRTKVDKTTTYVTPTIVHDQCSHVADALRMFAEASMNSMLGAETQLLPGSGGGRTKQRQGRGRAMMS